MFWRSTAKGLEGVAVRDRMAQPNLAARYHKHGREGSQNRPHLKSGASHARRVVRSSACAQHMLILFLRRADIGGQYLVFRCLLTHYVDLISPQTKQPQDEKMEPCVASVNVRTVRC